MSAFIILVPLHASDHVTVITTLYCHELEKCVKFQSRRKQSNNDLARFEPNKHTRKVIVNYFYIFFDQMRGVLVSCKAVNKTTYEFYEPEYCSKFYWRFIFLLRLQIACSVVGSISETILPLFDITHTLFAKELYLLLFCPGLFLLWDWQEARRLKLNG